MSKEILKCDGSMTKTRSSPAQLTLEMSMPALRDEQLRGMEEYAGERDARGYDSVSVNCGEVLALIAEVRRWRSDQEECSCS